MRERRLVVRPAAVLGVCFGVFALLTASTTSANPDVTAVQGSAYGYRAFNISLFGGAQPDTGPTPTVALASNASNSPQTATATTGLVRYGPATLFSSGPVSVTTSGSLGAGGSVTSSASVQSTNTSGSEILTAGSVGSTCTASEDGVTGATTIVSGTLRTDNGLDLNDDGDYTDPGEHAPVTVSLEVNPAPNTSIEGHVHAGGSSTDSFHVVLNEQVVNANGSLTVNAVHQYLLGPILTGDLIIGQVVCGVTSSAATTTTTVPPTTTVPTTTVPTTTVPTTTVPTTTVPTTTLPPTTTVPTTTLPPTTTVPTTTTIPTTTTTTVPPPTARPRACSLWRDPTPTRCGRSDRAGTRERLMNGVASPSVALLFGGLSFLAFSASNVVDGLRRRRRERR